MFKVLVISYNLPPSGLNSVVRPINFIKYLPKNNWQVTVITRGEGTSEVSDQYLLDKIKSSNIEIIRTDDIKSKSLDTHELQSEFKIRLINKVRQTFFLPDHLKKWSNKAAKEADNLIKTQNFDLLYVMCPPFSTFDAVVGLRKKYDIPIVVDYREQWLENYLSFYPTPFHKSIIKKAEYNSLKNVDKVIVTNRKAKEKLIETYPFLTFDDVVIIPNTYDEYDYRLAFPENKQNGKMWITQAGSLFSIFDPKVFFMAFKELINTNIEVAANVELHFLKPLKKEHKKLISKLAIDSFIFEHSDLTYEEYIRKIVSSDVLWLTMDRKGSKNIDLLTPPLAYEIMGSKKTIIAALPDGAMQIDLKKYGAAYISDTNNIQAVKNAIVECYELYKKGMMPKPNIEFVEQHKAEKVSELLAKTFQFYLREM